MSEEKSNDFLSRPFLHGQAFREARHRETVARQPLVSGLIYENSVVMIFSDDGNGKSLLTLQMCLQAASGFKVFSEFDVPRPIKVLYIGTERPEEPVERAKMMENVFEIKDENFILEDFSALNLANSNNRADILVRCSDAINQCFGGHVDLIAIDPIYALMSGQLAGEDGAYLITSLSTLLKSTFKCSILLVHHTNRGGRENGQRTEGDMYGSRFLSAHCTGTYHLKLKDDGSGSILTNKKDSHSNLEDKIELGFDPITQMSYYRGSGRPKLDRAKAVIKELIELKKDFSLEQVSIKFQVNKCYLREAMINHLKEGHLTSYRSSDTKWYYKIN